MTFYNTSSKLFCCFCNKECKNQNSLRQHEIRCKSNPNRINVIVEGFNTPGKSAWNKDKTAKTDERVRNNTQKVKEYYKTHVGSFTGKTHTEEEKQNLSNIAKQRGLGGFNMRKAKIEYRGIKLDSSYELLVASSLDDNNIVWERCKRFPYHYDDDSLHYYTPDFFLPEYNVYLDPKNDFLIHNVNKFTGMTDVEKIHRVEQENKIRIIVLDKESLSWDKILNMILAPVA